MRARSSCISRWPWMRRIGREPAFRCRSDAFRFAHSVSSSWSSIPRSYSSTLLLVGLLFFGGRCDGSNRLQSQRRAHLGLDVEEHLGVLLEIALGVLASLPDPLAAVRVPGAGLLHDVVLGGGVEHRALLGDALSVDDVELRLTERRRQLVLHDLDLGVDADGLGPV